MPQNFKIIEAPFNQRDRRCVVGPLWQYDYGQILKITGIELPENYEVHFSNDPHGFSKPVVGNAEGARIPAEYLKSGANVFAWLYVHQGEDDGSTEYQVEIQVRRRARPSDVVLEPEEMTDVANLIGSMNAALESAKEERQKAEDAATSAEEDAENADSFAKMSESYAVGGTGTREGEDTDNAKFYYESAKDSEAKAKESEQHTSEDRNAVEQAASTVAKDKEDVEEAKNAAQAAKDAAEGAKNETLQTAESLKVTPDRLGLEQDPETGYVYPTFDGTRSKNGIPFIAKTDESLKLEDGVLSVNRTNAMERDNTLPITSAGVYATVGNIEALLATI